MRRTSLSIAVALLAAATAAEVPVAAQEGGLAVVSSRGVPPALMRDERPRFRLFGSREPEPTYQGGVIGLLEAKPPAGFERTRVAFQTRERPGTIIIDSRDKYLYLVESDGSATRYGIGVGREGFAWAGRERISQKAEWPNWRPPAEMLARDPSLPTYMDGGVRNPLGARALYLGATLYRIHGTNEPRTSGTAQSSGCIRMTNRDVMDLYSRTQIGAPVIVLGPDSDRSLVAAALGRPSAAASAPTPPVVKAAPAQPAMAPPATAPGVAAAPAPLAAQPAAVDPGGPVSIAALAAAAPRAPAAGLAPAFTPSQRTSQPVATAAVDRRDGDRWWKPWARADRRQSAAASHGATAAGTAPIAPVDQQPLAAPTE